MHRHIRFIAHLLRGLAAALVLATSLPALAVIPASERAVLIALYNSTNGDGWTSNLGWKTGPGPNDFGAVGTDCSWYGVLCGPANSFVQNLSLASNGLVGTLPSTLNQLTSLRDMHFSQNQLSGTVPPLDGLTELMQVYLYDNQLSGPIPPLDGLTSLQLFYVFDNQLSGPPPVPPAGLAAAQLCPNLLHTPSLDDAAWNAAAPGGNWSNGCTRGYQVIGAASAGGAIGPASQGVVDGAAATLTLTPEPGWSVSGVASTCGGTQTGNNFTITAVTANCTVTASFARATTAVPTLGQWALMTLALLMAGLGLRRVRG